MASQASTSKSKTPLADSDVTKEIKKLHIDMVIRLSKHFTPSLKGPWEELLVRLSLFLEPADLNQDSFLKICDILMNKEIIDYGKYDELYEVIHQINVHPSKIIQETSERIQDLQAQDPQTSQPSKMNVKIPADLQQINIRTYHTQMIVKLEEQFSRQQWPSICDRVELMGYVGSRDMDGVGSMGDLCMALQRKGVISFGEYSNLREILVTCDVHAGEIIDDFTSKIRQEMEGPSPARQPRMEEQSTGNAVDTEMRNLICRGDISKLKARIKDGLDLSDWRDRNGDNIYHYCVYFDVSFETLRLAEAVPTLCHTHASLLQEWGHQSTPVLQACKMSVDTNKYNLAMLELFLQQVQDINYETLVRASRGNLKIHKFLTWRQTCQTGLPKELARMPNQYILSFIETIEEMDLSTAQQYMTSIQEQIELSTNIRIVILGYQGVGKTTLLLRLTGQDLTSLKSTDQIDIHQNLVIVDQDLQKYWLIPKELEHDVARSRLQNILTDSMSAHQREANTDPSKSMNKEAEVKNNSAEPLEAEHDFGEEVIYERYMALSRSQDVVTGDSGSVEKHPETSLKSEAGAAMLATNMTSLGSARSKAYVSIFDFGGEIMFSNFQHIFLNTNNVILLCFSLHNVFKKDKILERIYFWLNFLSTFAVEDKKYCPPVVLVGTHLDKVPEGDQRTIKDRVKDRLLRDEKHAAAYERHVFAFEVVANGDDPINDTRIPSDKCQEIIAPDQNKALWKQICAAAEYQSRWNQPLPAKWILLERDLMIMKGQGKKVVTLKEIKDRAKKLSVPLEDKDVTAMLSYLHGTRSILCFNLDRPDDKVILDIKFIIEAFRLIVTEIKFHKRKTHVDPSIQKEYGSWRLTMDFIHAVWRQGSEFHAFMETLLYYLERLELIVKPLPNDMKTVVDYYIVPYLLKEADPSQIREMLSDVGVIKSSTLCFNFFGRFIPPPVYNKILASCIHRFKLFLDKDGQQQKYLQQGLACFVLSPRWNLVLHCKDSSMKITLFSNTAHTINAGDGYSVRSILEYIVESTLERNSQEHIKFQYFLSEDFEVTKNEKMVKVELPIEESSQVDADIAVWCCPEQNQVQPADFPGTNLDKCLTRKEMSHVAKFIGMNYYCLFVGLELSSNEIDDVCWVCQKNCLRTLVTRLLVKWNNKFGGKAVVRRLLDVMNSNDFPTDDVIEHLHEMAKPCNPSSTSTDADRCPTEVERLLIAEKIGRSYVIFFLELDMGIETIEHAEMDDPKSTDRFKNLLKLWAQTNGRNAKLSQIYVAARESSMDWENLQKEIQNVRR